MVVSIRFYRKYQREKKREDQQELIKKQFERTNKSLRNREKSNGKIHKRQQDSLDSIRKIQRNNNMKLLKEAQKKLQEEEIKRISSTTYVVEKLD